MDDRKTNDKNPVQFVLIKETNTFWPACVYHSYLDATENLGDVSHLLKKESDLLDDESIILLFGIDSNSDFLKGVSNACKSNIMVKSKKDIVCHPWSLKSDSYESICRSASISVEIIKKTSMNPEFVRAMSEAATYNEINDKEEVRCL